MKTKLILFTLFILSMCMNSCNNTADTKTESQETKIDSAAYVLQVLDSLEEGGVTYHKEYSELGIFGNELNSFKTSVNCISLLTDTLYYFHIEGYDCNYGAKDIPETEIPTFRDVVKTMINACNKGVDVHEEISYISKSGLILKVKTNEEKSLDNIDMQLDGKYSRHLFLHTGDLTKLHEYLCQAQIKIKELKKK